MSVDIALFALGVLATARATRLVTTDTLTASLRARLEQRDGPIARFLKALTSCPWCFSIWAAAALFAYLAHFSGSPWWVYPLNVLAASQLAALIAVWLDPADYAMVPPRHQVLVKGA